MNSTSRYTPYQTYESGWQRVYDPDFNTPYYYNDQTQENSWNLPKKVKPNYENYIPVEKFISTDTTTSTEPTFLNHIAALPSSLNLISKCHRCNTEQNVRNHGYCGECDAILNSYEDPQMAKYRIKCQGCHGWGINLVNEDGFCSHCKYCLEHGLEIKTYDRPEILEKATYIQKESQFMKCKDCGGWGKDLVEENGYCAHCNREAEKRRFEAAWKTRCKTCGGWGLHLVNPEDGLCNHCRKQFDQERAFFSRVLDERVVMQQREQRERTNPNLSTINFSNNWNLANMQNIPNETLLGKRARKMNDFEM
jgi:hypothetical protein